MNTHFHKPFGVVVLLTTPKNFKMIQNRTVVSTVLMAAVIKKTKRKSSLENSKYSETNDIIHLKNSRKFDSAGSSEVSLRIHMLELNHFFSLPVPSVTNQFPVITSISISVSFPIRSHFLLPWQRRSNVMRMQITHFLNCSREGSNGFFPPLFPHTVWIVQKLRQM